MVDFTQAPDAVMQRVRQGGEADEIIGTGVLATAKDTTAAPLKGRTLNVQNTTYAFLIPTAGLAQLDVILRASTFTVGAGGTIAVQLTRMLRNGAATKGAAVAFAAFVVGTQQVQSLALTGERFVLLEIVLSNHAGHNVVFDQAEYCGRA